MVYLRVDLLLPPLVPSPPPHPVVLPYRLWNGPVYPSRAATCPFPSPHTPTVGPGPETEHTFRPQLRQGHLTPAAPFSFQPSLPFIEVRPLCDLTLVFPCRPLGPKDVSPTMSRDTLGSHVSRSVSSASVWYPSLLVNLRASLTLYVQKSLICTLVSSLSDERPGRRPWTSVRRHRGLRPRLCLVSVVHLWERPVESVDKRVKILPLPFRERGVDNVLPLDLGPFADVVQSRTSSRSAESHHRGTRTPPVRGTKEVVES